jgi:hypothetical protein
MAKLKLKQRRISFVEDDEILLTLRKDNLDGCILSELIDDVGGLFVKPIGTRTGASQNAND